MTIIDTHCHYNLDPLVENWKKHWKSAQQAGVRGSVIVGTDAATSQLGIQIAEQDRYLVATVGVHPNKIQNWIETRSQDQQKVSEIDLQQRIQTELTSLRELIDQQESSNNHNQVAALGEIGLDYYRLPKNKKAAHLIRTTQQYLLRKQLQIALLYELPVILHVRDKHIDEQESSDSAYWKTLHILEEELLSRTAKNAFPVPVILHCLSGPIKYVRTIVSFGGYAGVAGNSTYPSADALRTLISYIPSQRLLVETDAPYLAPQSHRGSSCEPWMITETTASLLKLTGVSEQQLLDNSLTIFPALS